MTAMLELIDVTKSFGGIRANDNVSLQRRAGRHCRADRA